MSHPILAAAAAMDVVLKDVADANPLFMSAAEKADALRELARLESRVAELRMRVLVAAGDVASEVGARDAASWYADATHTRLEDARAELRLASALDRRWSALGGALRDGRVNTAQARVVVRSLEDLPDSVPSELLDQAEASLIEHAQRLSPKQLARVGRHVLEVVAPEVVSEVEGKRLAALEAEGRRRTRLMLRRLGDGTTRLSGRLPDAVATRFATYLEAYANPRRDAGATPTGETAVTFLDPVPRLPYPRRLGEAFCQLLEDLDPQRLPVHGGDATTVVVTVALETLMSELGAADVLGAGTVPADPHGDPCAGERITAGEARRLACNARILPAVMGGRSEVLDLGRARRLFNAAQRKALLLRDETCRAVGCDVPGTWAEAHHWLPWLLGGPTDLDNAVLLCAHHHHRAHDADHVAERLPSGDVRFHRRR